MSPDRDPSSCALPTNCNVGLGTRAGREGDRLPWKEFGTGGVDLWPDPGDKTNSLCSGSRQRPRAVLSQRAEVLRKGFGRLIYLWDSGKGWGSLGEVLKPRSGVSGVSVIYLEWDNASDRRKKK